MKKIWAFLGVCFWNHCGRAADLKVGDPAPHFELSTQAGRNFKLESRAGTWTVLYFYPKAGTPGCTKQACAFRDNLKKIRDEGAEVYGVSGDDVPALKKFYDTHHLNFELLADPKDQVLDAYGTKLFGLPISKRWTFIIDPELKIRAIDKDVDPVMDAAKVAADLKRLKTP